jgi:hypothetical protein
VRTNAAQVHLRRRHAYVPERIAHDIEGAPAPDKVDRERVAQPVRMRAALDARLPSEPRQQVPDVRLVHRPPRERAEERAGAPDAAPPARVDPLADERGGPGVNTDYPALAALPPLHDEGPGLGIEVIDRERERLADPEPAPPQDGDERPIADACRARLES